MRRAATRHGQPLFTLLNVLFSKTETKTNSCVNSVIRCGACQCSGFRNQAIIIDIRCASGSQCPRDICVRICHFVLDAQLICTEDTVVNHLGFIINAATEYFLIAGNPNGSCNGTICFLQSVLFFRHRADFFFNGFISDCIIECVHQAQINDNRIEDSQLQKDHYLWAYTQTSRR